MAATLMDVAKRACVTPTTVSNVVKSKGSVGEETRRRVLAAIEELGYRPNLVARALAQQRSYTLGLLVPTIANPFYPEIVLEAERIGRAHGYHLLVCNTFSAPQTGRGYLDDLANRCVDGLIITGGSIPLPDIRATVPPGLPVVLCAWDEDHVPLCYDTVDVDFRYGGALAAHHLVQLGHQRVAMILQQPSHAPRLEGFRAALMAAGSALPAEYVVLGDSTPESGYQAARTLLALPSPPSAIFAANDLMALGAMEAAIDRGLRLPDDLSVVGLDDIALVAHWRPALTTIAIPKGALMAKTMELLLRRVDGRITAPCAVSLRPELIIRQSTAAPLNAVALRSSCHP